MHNACKCVDINNFNNELTALFATKINLHVCSIQDYKYASMRE